MFNIVLYNFNKRPNSLKKPTAQTTGQTIQCVMKSVSSVITPIIEISDPKLTNSIPLYNYAYRRKHIPTTVRVYKFGKEVFVDFNTVPNATAFPLDVKQEKFKIAFHNKFLYLLVTVMPFAALFILK